MADTQPTPSTPSSPTTPSTPTAAKSAIKADQYVPAPRSGQPRVEKADQTDATTKNARATAAVKECWKHRLQVLKKELGSDEASVSASGVMLAQT